ncbi:alpha/beta hydrolase [Paracoccus aestuarii]|uniref:Alpha/beta hydrolase n=1 Tax=Paracoccus aestuarii TaxID=453842 RepID=A0A418ZYL6_9RHOB|nr:alpha/beta hydrolase [Paracoccus aestuarii]RJL05634.1 alpha/beta hydrolase [Paracoccus aestuarii]WCQ97918.1 alpha/beta hydrolase [Paracoccus aestuarii]
MTRILLIHGAWHDGRCWAGLAAALRARGWAPVCPDLPGGAETTLRDCIDALPDAPVVLGHSMGGILAEALAQRHAPRLLIHLCSYLPLPGDSLAALDRLLPAPTRAWPRDAQGRLVLPPDAARRMMGTDPALLRPQPLGPMRAPLPGPARAATARHYILCRRDRAIPPALQRAMIIRAGVDRVHARPWDHAPFLSDPAGLAALIDRIGGMAPPRKG